MNRPAWLHLGSPGRGSVTAFLAGLSAVALVAVAAVAFAGGGEGEYRPRRQGGAAEGRPAGSLDPGEPSLPAGARPIPILAPGESTVIGGMLVLPAGGVPSHEWALLPDIREWGTSYRLDDPSALARAAANRVAGVALTAPPVPAGFQLVAAAAETYRKAPGSTEFAWQTFYNYTAPDQFPIAVETRLLKPGALVEVVQYEQSTGLGLASMEIAGVTVVLSYGTAEAKNQPVANARFILAGVDVAISADAVPPQIVVDFVRSWIETHRAIYKAAAQAGGMSR